MTDHIAYAMRNEVATQQWISFNNPFNLLDWSHTLLEATIIIGFLLAIAVVFTTGCGIF